MIASRYEIGDSIGTGGMSDVYQATDTILGRDVAIKILRNDLARDDGFRERFKKEAQNSAQLNHPAIVSVYDTGTIHRDGMDVPYIVMELVHGTTLRDVGPLPVREAAKIMEPVAQALACSHEAGIIHRDIKPANIMITNTGDVKVMDFGIAHATTDTTSAMTQTSAVIGTAQYLSPEQARGKVADGRSDIYATGCVFYELVTGHPPFEGETPFAVAYQHVTEDPAAPSTLVAGLTPSEALALDAVTLTAMAKNPHDRYQTAGELAEEFGTLARGGTPLAARSYAEPGATAVAEPEPAAAVAVGEPADFAESPEDAEPDEPKSNPWRWIVAVLAAIFLALAGVFAYNYLDLGGSNQKQTSQSVAIPQIANLPTEEALTKLESAGLKTTIKEETSPTVEKNHIIRTSPAENSRVPAGTTVEVYVSTGKEITEVPDLKNLNTADAQKRLEEEGLKLATTVKEDNSDTVKEGLILEQSPSAGSQVSKGTEVTITVSIGQKLVRVPAQNGTTFETAQSNLKAMGFGVQMQMVDGVEPEGTVISTAGEGTEVAEGTVVTVKVSNGQLIRTPNLVGLHVTQVGKTLEAAGHSGATNQQETPSTNLTEIDKVATQDPAAGTPIRKDQPVTIQVFTFAIPNVN
ncbi:Stk1 family PASTA domain-containing Ser/Thr kinase [Corynebacterium glucuronolyticum]